MTTTLITLDWGTTSLRAWRISADGTILEGRDGGPGIMKVGGGAFEAALVLFCGDWLAAHRDAALIACGMIGSKQGWIEAPYCACPAGIADVASQMTQVSLGDDRRLSIVPGVSTRDPASGLPDVMRGEETQVFGALPPSGRHLAILPGSHSKWVRFEGGRIVGFDTYMTGEVYAALSGHTILGRLMTPGAPHASEAFERGARLGLDAPQALLARLFSTRTLGLFGQLPAEAAASYLSGLLIGSEVGHALDGGHAHEAPVLIGDGTLVQRYQQVLALAGVSAARAADTATATGLVRLSRMRAA